MNDLLNTVERFGGWVASGVGLLILKRLKSISIEFDGWMAKLMKDEKKESFEDGQKNERNRKP